MKLVVLESPNKVKKIAHYLGSGYEVLATAGHFRDLPRDDLGVDTETFQPHYVVDPDKAALLARIKAKAKEAEEVLLATDADREGEAISWHLAQELHLKRPMRLKAIEITEKALKQAAAHLVPLDQHLVDAQQARRVLDRLVGYQVSPLLQRFGRGNSAGRVQSATLHLVVLRELERERFTSEPYWTLASSYGNGLRARYATVDKDGKLADTRFKSESEANAVAERARAARHAVKSVETKPAESRPSPPFTTSTLQQAASSQLHFTPDRTMALAQKLFEQGAITYHRTDSVALSDEAIDMARAFIAKDYPEALPEQPVKYKQKGNAQGAHEAIRPTSLDPDATNALAGDELALYDLVRRRFVACQCKPAVLSRTTITIEAADTIWRAIGSVVVFESFRRYLDQGTDQEKRGDVEDDDQELPKVAQGEVLELEAIDVQAKKTKPPPRYTQASLIDAMEKTGIGRPSTYAPTVKLLFDRNYIAEEKKQLYPTPEGRRIDSALGQTFPEILETRTTAELEKNLDEIAEGQRPWKAELEAWYGPFSQRLAAAAAILDVEAAKYPELKELAQTGPKPTGKPCPRCGAELHLRQRKGGKGEFLSCSAYPKCEYAADASAKASEKPCPKCGGRMDELVGKFGPYAKCIKADCGTTIDLAPETSESCPVCSAPMKDKGEFLSCTKYPACKGSYDKKALAKAKKNNTRCPDCGAFMLEKKGAKGLFLGCSAYPKCKTLQNLPAKRK